jgi:hypothetical protein
VVNRVPGGALVKHHFEVTIYRNDNLEKLVMNMP